MSGPTREWVTFTDPADPERPMLVDVTFFTSRWDCIFGNGCEGVLTAPTPELVQGCCSYGAHFSDKADRDDTVRWAKKLRADEWQFRDVGHRRGIYAKVGKKEWRTRLVDDACIFLNRPGFPAGAGCAFHVHAANNDLHHSDTKPEVCWQLPIRRIPVTDDEGEEFTRLTEFARDGWGEGGEDFGWWCTEAPEAFVNARPVYRSLEPELRKMLGDALFEEVAAYLDTRMGPGAPPVVVHPAQAQQVPIHLGPSRNGSKGPKRSKNKVRAQRD
ncbi:MAG: hypothetical protein ACXW2C_10415 [Acidimicrobiia bacterium]